MRESTDMPSVVSGATKKSSAAPIRKRRLKSIFGKSGAAEGRKVLVDARKPGGILAYFKARKPPGFLFILLIYFIILYISSGKFVSKQIFSLEIG